MSGPAENKLYEDGAPVEDAAVPKRAASPSGIRSSLPPEQRATKPPPADYDAKKLFKSDSPGPDAISHKERSELDALLRGYLADEHRAAPEVHTFSVEVLVSRDTDISDFLEVCTLAGVDLRPFFEEAQAFFDENKVDETTGISVLHYFLGEFIKTFLGVVTDTDAEVDGNLQFSFSSAFANVKMLPVDTLKSFDQRFRELCSEIPAEHFGTCLKFIKTL